MPHAETHTAIWPHAIAYNAPAAADAMVRASRAMGGREPPAALYELASKLGAEMSLAKLGMPEEGIEIAAKLAIQNPYPNPRPVTEDGIRALLARAYTGAMRSEEHTSELQSLMRISYAVFCLKKKK